MDYYLISEHIHFIYEHIKLYLFLSSSDNLVLEAKKISITCSGYAAERKLMNAKFKGYVSTVIVL